MSAVVRVKLSRKAGWEKPPNTVVVSRPSRWGNPFRMGYTTVATKETRSGVRLATRAECVEAFRVHLFSPAGAELLKAVRDELRGKNLACWCALNEPCHADVLLEIANA